MSYYDYPAVPEVDYEAYYSITGEWHPSDPRWFESEQEHPEQEYPEQEMPPEVAADILRAVREQFARPGIDGESVYKRCGKMPADIVSAIDVALVLLFIDAKEGGDQ